MQQKTKDIQNHFEGFLKTPSLWTGNAVYNLKQFQIDQKSISLNKEIDGKLRLGKYIERFVSYQLSQHEQLKIISENIQIQKGQDYIRRIRLYSFERTEAHSLRSYL